MEARQGLSKVKMLFVGIAMGVAIILIIGAIGSYLDPGTALTGHPKKFGDITIFVQEAARGGDALYQDEDIDQMLFMAKADVPFLTIGLDNSGKINGLSLLDKRGKLSFTMTPSTDSGRWKGAIYAAQDNTGCTVGEMFVDINFDGRFDIRRIYDDTGKKVSSYIYIDQGWKKIDRCNFEKAIAGTTTYIFDFNDKWEMIE